jgi:hypothetical protein
MLFPKYLLEDLSVGSGSILICPKNLFSDLSEPKRDHKGSSKTYVDEIQCLIENTSSMDLNASLDII